MCASLFVLSCAEEPGFKVSDTGVVLSSTEQGAVSDGENALGTGTGYSSGNESVAAEQGHLDSSNASPDATKPESESSSGNAQTKFKESCTGTVPKTLIQRVHFPEIKNCRFGYGGNLNRRDRYLQARESQSKTLQLPQGAQLCGIELHSEEGRFQYDDFMILTLNDIVLFSSNSKILNGLAGTAQGALSWDFTKVRGSAVDFDSPAYCLGGATSACKIPVTDTPGQFEVGIESEILSTVADKIVDQSSFAISLTTTGDNDDEDCWHTAIDLDFTLHYVE